MLSITIIVLSLLLFFFLSSYKYEKDSFLILDKKKHPLRILYPCVAFIQHKLLKKDDNLIKDDKLYSYQKASITFLCIILTFFLVFLYEIQQLSKHPEIQNNSILRPQALEGAKTVDAIYYIDADRDEISIEVPEVILQGEERKKLIETAFLELDHLILGDNTSFNEITQDLYFPKQLVSNHVIAKYSVRSLDLIRYDGSVQAENISETGNIANVVVDIIYDTTTVSKTYEFILLPQTVSTKSQLKEQLTRELKQSNEASKYDEVFILPDKIGDEPVKWLNINQKNSMLLLLVGVILAAMLPALLDKKKKEKEEKERLLLQRDYPEIVSKLQLLLNAGMTIRGAWERIVLDYLRVKEQKQKAEGKLKKRFFKKSKGYQRPAYEQMLITKREQEVGVSEGISYERFGKRCKAISYIRLSSLITQNIKMGSKGLAQLLETEARNAFDERKEFAKQLGEKASTKLLGPTMGMLIIILCIIMVPAFTSL